MRVRVGVADDQPLIRTGLRALIDHAADVELVGEAADGEEAVELARRHNLTQDARVAPRPRSLVLCPSSPQPVRSRSSS